MAPCQPELRLRLEERDDRLRRDALVQLGGLGDDAEPAIQKMAHLLTDGNRHVQRATLNALEELCSAEDHFEPNSKGRQVWLRGPSRAAALALPELVKGLASEDIGIRRAARRPLVALKATGLLGEISVAAAPALPELQQRLEDEDWRIRQAAAEALPDTGAAAIPALPALAKLTVDLSALVRDMAATSIQRCLEDGLFTADYLISLPPAIPAVIDAFGSKDPLVRVAAAKSLGTCGHAAMISGACLANVVKNDCDLAKRCLAAEVLANLGLSAVPHLPALAYVLTHQSEPTLSAAICDALDKIWREVADCLGRAAKESYEALGSVSAARYWVKQFAGDAFQRDKAIRELCKPGPARIAAVPELMQALSVPNHPAMVLGSPSATSVLQAFEDLQEVGALGSPAKGNARQVMTALVVALRDPAETVRLGAIEALISLGRNVQAISQPIRVAAKSKVLEKQLAAEELSRELAKAGSELDGKLAASWAAHELLDCAITISDARYEQASSLARTLFALDLVPAAARKAARAFDPSIPRKAVKGSKASPSKTVTSDALSSAASWKRGISGSSGSLAFGVDLSKSAALSESSWAREMSKWASAGRLQG